MIGRLKGTLADVGDGVVLLDVAGVGYEVQVSNGVLSALPPIGQGLELLIYTDVRENSITLVGFASKMEREVFNLLKLVKGIGSKMALNVLSGMRPEALLVAIGAGDLKALAAAPGIGKKTAERVIVELREKVGELASGLGTGSSVGSLAGMMDREVVRTELRELPGPAVDAVLALEKLGFSVEQARGAVVRGLGKGNSPLSSAATLEAGEILRLALSSLSS